MSAGWDTTPTADLGVCTSPDELVPGDTASMTGYADRLRRIASGAARVGWLLSRVDAGALVGSYGTALRERLAVEPAPYEQTALSLAVAADAVDGLVAVIEDARAVARQAVGLWNDAQSTTKTWDTARQLHETFPGPVPAPAAADPGEHLREQARRLLDGAQHDVATAAERTRAVLHEVARSALTLDGGFWKGAGDAWKDLFAFAARAATQPSDTARATADEAVRTATHPRQALEQETDELNRKPDEYLGGMVATGPLGPLGKALQRITDDDADGRSDADVGEGDDDTSGDDTPVPRLDLPHLWHHIFHGEINKWGKPVGYHHRQGGLDPPDRELLGPVTDGDQGTYSVPNVLFTRPDGTQVKKGYTSFFPDDWSPDQVEVAVSEAFRSPDVIVESDGSWQGYSSSGLMIRGYLGKDGQPATAYPYVPTKGTP